MSALLAAGLFLIAFLTAFGMLQLAPKLRQGRWIYIFISACAIFIEVCSGLVLLG